MKLIKKFIHYYRSPKTKNERTANDDLEIREYVRPKRNKNNLPTSWDDIPIKSTKSWKDISKKRHSWE